MYYVSQNLTRPAQDVTYFGRVSMFFGYLIFFTLNAFYSKKIQLFMYFCFKISAFFSNYAILWFYPLTPTTTETQTPPWFREKHDIYSIKIVTGFK